MNYRLPMQDLTPPFHADQPHPSLYFAGIAWFAGDVFIFVRQNECAEHAASVFQYTQSLHGERLYLLFGCRVIRKCILLVSADAVDNSDIIYGFLTGFQRPDGNGAKCCISKV
ncbi:MAG TPA: hypothetical protein VN631_18760 [Negativicutes bacterium]|nr:hypothetical protein [Negativicutes bacterium]